MTRKEFAKLFYSLALQLRATVGEIDLRAYYAVFSREPEPLVRAAAERWIRIETWSPKTSAWLATMRAVEAERREAQRDASRREALCAACEAPGGCRGGRRPGGEPVCVLGSAPAERLGWSPRESGTAARAEWVRSCAARAYSRRGAAVSEGGPSREERR